MSSVRARIAMVLVASIICVIGVATATTFLVMRGLEEKSFGFLVARQLVLLAPLFQRHQDVLSPETEPAPGTPDQALTKAVQRALLRAGTNSEVVVVQSPARHLAASIKLDGGWLHVPLPDRRVPPEAWIALASWMSLIAIGTVAVALAFAHRITRHLTMLENVALMVDTHDFLPQLPENGPTEIKATARALNHMATRLKAAIDSRKRLVAAAGHDLRTPLTRMRLRAEFFDEQDRLAWLNDLDELERIAESAIQLVREEAGPEKRELLRIDEMIGEICEELTSIGLPVTAANRDGVTISCSPLGLKRALRNLVINAATHGGGASISLRLSGPTASIVIEDNGPGIPEELMPRVFEPFFRADPARRQSVPGAGLGLAIAKEIIEREGGRLTLRNRGVGGLRQEVRFAAVLHPARPPEHERAQ
jgi:signal transduction histidine kinase